jgi:hypothetical protein
VQRRLLIGAALLVLGSAAGVGAAWWRRTTNTQGTAARAPDPATARNETGVAPSTAPAPAPATATRLEAAGDPGIVQRDAAEMVGSSTPTDWRLARLRGNPQILVLEFPNLAEQGAALNRTAAFVEKAAAPRDRVLDDVELQQLIARQGDNAQTFYQGHDYLASQLARFFTLARAQRLTLSAQEQRLLRLLLEKRVLAQEGASYSAQGLQAVVTFTATQTDDPTTPQDETVDVRRRESVLLHELSHGLFFTNAAYRDHCWRFWRERLAADERTRFRQLLARMNYDPNAEELLVNEMQALLMHTPDTRAFGAASLGISDAQLGQLRERFRKGMPAAAAGRGL